MKNMKWSIVLAGLILILSATVAFADDGYPWRDHAAPFDYLFGNHIDTHQQAKVVGKDKLTGFLYIRYTDDVTEDGVSVAEHGNCSMSGDCTVGWNMQGIATEAEYCGHPMDQHPTWAIDLDDMPQQPGFTHFHWKGAPEHAGGLAVGEVCEGYVLRLIAQDHFFFRHHGGFDITPGIDYESHANIVTDCSELEN